MDITIEVKVEDVGEAADRAVAESDHTLRGAFTTEQVEIKTEIIKTESYGPFVDDYGKSQRELCLDHMVKKQVAVGQTLLHPVVANSNTCGTTHHKTYSDKHYDQNTGVQKTGRKQRQLKNIILRNKTKHLVNNVKNKEKPTSDNSILNISSKLKRRKLFECDICEYTCRTERTLRKHLHVHLIYKLLICDICEQQFTRKANLRQHIMIHTGVKPYACGMCDYRCIVRANLTKHIRTHTGEKPFACDMCQVKCATTQSLMQHRMIHTGERPFACDMCEYKCITKSKLYRHKRTHTGMKPFTCDVCQSNFTRKDSLISHKALHVGKEIYVCDTCEYKSITKSSLNRHKRAKAH